MKTTAMAPAKRLVDLPAPKGLPLVGNLLSLDPLRLHLILERWHAELGSPFRLRMGPRDVYVSADAELMQSVLRERPERYRRMRQLEALTELPLGR